MILINLLPPEFRKQKLRSPLGPLPESSRRLILIGGIFFVGLTLVFYTQYLFSLKTLGGLKKRWPVLQQEVQRINQIREDIEKGSKREKEFLENYVTSSFPTTNILTGVSKLLPDSMWLVELKLSRQPDANTFLLKGLAVPPKGRSSIQEIEEYLRALKDKFPKSTSLILTTSRQQKEGMELTLFTAVFKWR